MLGCSNSLHKNVWRSAKANAVHPSKEQILAFYAAFTFYFWSHWNWVEIQPYSFFFCSKTFWSLAEKNQIITRLTSQWGGQRSAWIAASKKKKQNSLTLSLLWLQALRRILWDIESHCKVCLNTPHRSSDLVERLRHQVRSCTDYWWLTAQRNILTFLCTTVSI